MTEYLYAKDLANIYGVKIATVQKWAREGVLPETYRRTGRSWVGAPYEWTPDQLKGWQPPKRGNSANTELEPRSRVGMWDVAKAASETGHPAGNIYRWVRSGHLRGFLSGGKVYVWPEDLRGFEPPKRGRPKKPQDICEPVPSEDAWTVPGSEDISEGELSEGELSEGSWPYLGL